MPVSVSAGYPQQSGTFIPQIWSGNLNVKFYAGTCLTQISNSKYEGEIKNQGDEVIIRQTPDIIISDYAKNGVLTTQFPEAATLSLKVDKAKSFQFKCDDIDKYQSDISLMEDWSRDASEQMKLAIERAVFGAVYADAHAYNKGASAGKISAEYNLGTTGSAVGLTKSTIVDKIVEMGVVLDEQDVPETDRWLLMPSWACGMLKVSPLQNASLTGDAKSPIRNGLIGRIDRFDVYRSNLVPWVTDTNRCFYIMAGHKSALTFAAQMTKMETLRAESTFGDIVRGLNVYGYKVVKPEAMAVLYAYAG